MSETLKKGEKSEIRDEKGKFLRGHHSGRPKGAKDKIARTVKENIEKAFEDLGGVEELVTWAKKSNNNREKFYQWYFSMLPKSESVEFPGGLAVTLNRIITTENPNGVAKE